MLTLETITYVAMLAALWLRYPGPNRNSVCNLQTLIFMEFPVQLWLNTHHPHIAYRFWFATDQLDLLLTLWCAYLIWQTMPVAASLMIFQTTLTMVHYALINRVHEFRHRGWWLFVIGKWLDIVINLAVVYGCFKGDFHARSTE